jgi:hypothetical protein
MWSARKKRKEFAGRFIFSPGSMSLEEHSVDMEAGVKSIESAVVGNGTGEGRSTVAGFLCAEDDNSDEGAKNYVASVAPLRRNDKNIPPLEGLHTPRSPSQVLETGFAQRC